MTKPKRTDKERLDWLTRNPDAVVNCIQVDHQAEGTYYQWCLDDGLSVHNTPRAAIDDAMKAEAKEKRHAKG